MSEKAKKEKKRNWLQDKLEAVKTWYRRDDNFLRIVRFPGTKLPLLDVAIDFFKLFIKGRTIDRAAGVAFNFILALAPLFLFLFTMIPIIPVPDLKFKVMDAINTFLIPSGTATFVTDTIDEIMNQPREGLMSVGIILCLVFGSSGVVAIFNGFRNVYANYVAQKQLTLKGWILQRLRAILLLVVVMVLLLLSISLISLGSLGLHFLVEHEVLVANSLVFTMFNLLRWMVAVLALCFTFALLYYYGNVQFGECYQPERKHPKTNGKKYHDFVIFSPGVLMATALFILGTVGFNLYIRNFSRYNVLYGSIGTMIILMLWIWIVAILLLAGNDLNNSLRRRAHLLSTRESDSGHIEIVIEDLMRNIKHYEESNARRLERIESLKKEMEAKQIVVTTLEKEIANQNLVIEAYKRFAEEELKRQSRREQVE